MCVQFLELFLLLFSYLCGSIPFGKLVAHSYGIDIQKRGSGNIGFANVRRIIGWRAGIITLVADILKGYVTTLIAASLVDTTMAYFVGLSAIIGHIFPVWLGFKGGKGIATGLGVVLALSPIAGLVGAATYVVSAMILQVSSYSSMIGLLTTSVIAISISPSTWWHYVLLASIATWTLRHNLTGKVPNYDT